MAGGPVERELESQAKRTRGEIAASWLKSRIIRGRSSGPDLEKRFISNLHSEKWHPSGFFASAPVAFCGRIGPLEAATLEFVDSRGRGRIGARPPACEPA
jgi:hypothetical protein